MLELEEGTIPDYWLELNARNRLRGFIPDYW
jgi:hypothetical protein